MRIFSIFMSLIAVATAATTVVRYTSYDEDFNHVKLTESDKKLIATIREENVADIKFVKLPKVRASKFMKQLIPDFLSCSHLATVDIYGNTIALTRCRQKTE